MRTDIEERAVRLAEYITENRATVRAAAKKFGVSKSTVHKDITERLEAVDPALFAEVRQLLELNKAERHIRGGLATRRKYQAALGGIAQTSSADQVASGGQAAPGGIARAEPAGQTAPGGIAQTSSAVEAERSAEIGNEEAGGG